MDTQATRMRDEEEFEAWFNKERKEFEANEPATFTDSDEWLMKKGYLAALAAERARSAVLVEALFELRGHFHDEHMIEMINDYIKQYRGLSEN